MSPRHGEASPYLFTREQLVELLDELGERLDRQGIHAEVFVVGGSAMALAYNTRRVTRDIDAVFEPKSVIYAEARRMADERGIPRDWLNDGVKGFFPDRPDSGEQVRHSARGISVSVASPGYLFAMKGMAARDEEDTEDLVTLAGILAITTADEALDAIERFYDRSRMTPKSQFVIQAIFDDPELQARRPGLPSADLGTDVLRPMPPPSGSSGSGGRVRGYRKSDGTVVRPHQRRR